AGEGMDAERIFPEIPALLRQAGFMAKTGHEVGALNHKIGIESMGEIDIAIHLVVLPEGPNHESRLVLLDRHEPFLFVRVPGCMRAGGDGSVGIIFLKKVAPAVSDPFAEIKKVSRYLGEAGKIEGVGDKGSVAGP